MPNSNTINCKCMYWYQSAVLFVNIYDKKPTHYVFMQWIDITLGKREIYFDL